MRVGLVETELANVRSNDFIASVVPKGQTERCTVENDQHGEEAAEIEESLFRFRNSLHPVSLASFRNALAVLSRTVQQTLATISEQSL